MAKSKESVKKVAVLIESSRAYGRGLIRGIGQFIEEHRDWQVEYRPRGLSEPVPHWTRNWKGDGILARINDRRMLRSLLKPGIPVLDLRRTFSSDRIPQVGPNDEETVSMVFEHFRNRGFQRFAYVGLPLGEHVPMDLRRTRFRQLVTDRKYPYSEMEISLVEFDENSGRAEGRLVRWLRKLPARTAVLACNDDLGLQTLNACRTAGISVPETCAVAGIGNDECLCLLGSPKLTSVDLNPVRIGFEAAAMLQEMMERPGSAPPSLLVRPSRIVPRASTDTIASEDAVVSAMVRYIRQEACHGIAVRDVLKRAKISRSALERRFKETVGHSIFQEITSVRLERVQELLISTDLTIREITAQTGFNYQGYLMQIFQKQFGMTMKAFRKSGRS